MRCTQGTADGNNRLTFVDVVGSTQDEVAELARRGAAHGTAVAARRQTAGRGRRGHRWKSPEGNLYLSVLLAPNLEESRLSGISTACCLGEVALLSGIAGGRVQLKWPNDLVADGRKMGGVLCELVPTEWGTRVVCGAGVNLHAPELPSPAVDEPTRLDAAGLDEVVVGGLPRLEDLARDMTDSIVAHVDAWAAALADQPEGLGPIAPLHDEYLRHLAYLGRPVLALAPDGAELARGTLVDVDSWGRAVVEGKDGTRASFSPEQASLRPAGAARG